jgi:hypothetical protein
MEYYSLGFLVSEIYKNFKYIKINYVEIVDDIELSPPLIVVLLDDCKFIITPIAINKFNVIVTILDSDINNDIESQFDDKHLIEKNLEPFEIVNLIREFQIIV